MSDDPRIEPATRLGYEAVRAFRGDPDMVPWENLEDRDEWLEDGKRALLGYTAASLHAERHIGKQGAVAFHKAEENARREVTLFIEVTRSLANALGPNDGRVQHITVNVEGAIRGAVPGTVAAGA